MKKKTTRLGLITIDGEKWVSSHLTGLCEHEAHKYNIPFRFEVGERVYPITEIIRYHEAKIKQALKWDTL